MPPPKKKCAVCKNLLKGSWLKPLCRTCIAEVVKEEASTSAPSGQPKESLSSFRKELENTFSSFRSFLEKRPVSQSAPRASTSSHGWEVSESEDEEPKNLSGSEAEEGDEDKDPTPSRYRLSLEEVDDLLKTIHTTLNIKEDKAQLSLYDKMFQGLEEVKYRTFPVHKVLSEAVKREWKDPERAPFFSKSLKRRFPFDEDVAQVWNKKPKLDAAFSKVSRNTDLAFEDMGTLKDNMDKRADALLKKAWDSTLANLKPALASTVVARNLEHWLDKLKSHIEAGTPRKDLLETLPVLLKAVGYMADASAESVKMSARSSALIISARRALWVKTWSGDAASKVKLCGLPFEGDLVFGSGLEAVLDRTADRKKAFPLKKVIPQTRKNFRSFFQAQNSKETPRGGKSWRPQRGRGKPGVLFQTPNQPAKPQ